MNCLLWLTDLHFNFLTPNQVEAFCQRLVAEDPSGVLIGGDIGEADTAATYLQTLEAALQRPIYFVLGNHDFYGGSIDAVRAEMRRLARDSRRLHWLPTAGIVPLTEGTCLIGHGAWADGRLGNYRGSDVMLNDYFLIRELTGLDRATRLTRLNELGDEAATYLDGLLPRALDRFHHVILLTHAPPFREACWHEGEISDENWLPHFSCKAVGDVLIRRMREHEACEMTVLCGHTHSAGRAQILPNLHVKTGRAVYGRPQIQGRLTLDTTGVYMG